MPNPERAFPVIDLSGDTVEKREKALKAIFHDPYTFECMAARLKNTDKPEDREMERKRRKEALKAFSKNPPEFWDMCDGRNGD